MVSRPQLPPWFRATGSSLQPFRVQDERKDTMNSRVSRTEQLLAELQEKHRVRDATERRISRRKLLSSTAGSAVVRVVGIGGLLELLANREAIAAGTVLALEGVT